jgi:hypothetical protein
VRDGPDDWLTRGMRELSEPPVLLETWEPEDELHEPPQETAADPSPEPPPDPAPAPADENAAELLAETLAIADHALVGYDELLEREATQEDPPPSSEDQLPDYGLPRLEKKLVAQSQQDPELRTTSIVDWRSHAAQHPPPFNWIINEWLPLSFPALFSGAGGTGKSLIAQALGTSIAMGIDYLGDITTPLRVLMWTCEDSEDEICRREVAICRRFGIDMPRLADRFMLDARIGLDSTLLAVDMGALRTQPALTVLREQVNDLAIDFLMLDNIAQVFGGNENDRHQTTTLVNCVRSLRPNLSVMLVGHTSRAAGSEFSGSSAWENAVRTRWYLATKLPDQNPADDEEPPPANGERFLCKRKTNYSERDYRRLTFIQGLFQPEQAAGPGKPDLYERLRLNRALDIVVDGVKKLASQNLFGSEAGRTALPRMLMQYELNGTYSKVEVTRAMRLAIMEGRLRREQIGVYSNRAPRFGLIVP